MGNGGLEVEGSWGGFIRVPRGVEPLIVVPGSARARLRLRLRGADPHCYRWKRLSLLGHSLQHFLQPLHLLAALLLSSFLPAAFTRRESECVNE